MEEVFLTGDNAKCVPTDTCKNTMYCLAKEHNFNSIEEFAIIACKHFLATYPDVVNKVTMDIKADRWERVVCPDSNGRMAPHKHGFKRVGPSVPYCTVSAVKRGSSPTQFVVKSGVRSLDVLKTTMSGFVGFHQCRYTSLQDATDRILGTSIDAEWTFNASALRPGFKFHEVNKQAEAALVNTILGPADTGVYSKSVQETLQQMATAVLAAQPSVQDVTLKMPNIHNLTFPLEKYGIENKDHTGNPVIFYPIDEPHGMIQATVHRTSNNRSRL